MSITKRRITHVGELDVALRARVHEKVAVDGVELRRGDDLSQLLHVHGFDVDDVYGYAIRGNRRAGKRLHSLKLWSLIFRFQRFIRRSSAEM